MAKKGPMLTISPILTMRGEDLEIADIDDVESSDSDSDLDSLMSPETGKTQTTPEKPKKRRCVIS